MANESYPRRYAQAIFEIAQKRNALDEWLSILHDFARISSDAIALALFENPRVRFEDKKQLINRITGEIDPVARNLVLFLIARGKLNITGSIYESYRDLLNKNRGVANATVTTALPLSDDERQKIVDILNTISGKTVIVTENVDSDIIGGVIARIDGKLLDGSTRTKLQELREKLIGIKA